MYAADTAFSVQPPRHMPGAHSEEYYPRLRASRSEASTPARPLRKDCAETRRARRLDSGEPTRASLMIARWLLRIVDHCRMHRTARRGTRDCVDVYTYGDRFVYRALQVQSVFVNRHNHTASIFCGQLLLRRLSREHSILYVHHTFGAQLQTTAMDRKITCRLQAYTVSLHCEPC